MSKQKESEKTNEQNSANDISLKIISIPDKEWKEYREQAPQDELLVLGIGMKLWLAKTRKSAFFCTLALLLSVIAGILVTILARSIVGVVILVLGYLIFCTLCIRRHFIKSSLSQTKSKLDAEIKKALDAEFKTSGGAKFAEVFISIILYTLCEPYAIALAVVSAIIPSLLNTKLVIPEGFGFEALEEVKEYYAEKSFLSEVIDICADYNRNEGKYYQNTATYRNDYGQEVDVTEQPYGNGNGEKVYKDKYGKEYYSDDGGKTVHEKIDGE